MVIVLKRCQMGADRESADEELELVNVLQRYSGATCYSQKRIFRDMELYADFVVEALVEAAQ